MSYYDTLTGPERPRGHVASVPPLCPADQILKRPSVPTMAFAAIDVFIAPPALLFEFAARGIYLIGRSIERTLG